MRHYAAVVITASAMAKSIDHCRRQILEMELAEVKMLGRRAADPDVRIAAAMREKELAAEIAQLPAAEPEVEEVPA